MPTDLLVLFSERNIIIFILIVTRLSGMIFSAPLFSTYPIPRQVKIWLVVAIAVLIFPTIATKGLLVPHDMPEMLVYMFKEFGLGYLVGFLANLIFVACQVGAEIISVQAGLAIGNVLDPVTKVQSNVLGQLYVLPASLIFLAINAHHWLFLTVCNSFKTIPPGYNIFFSADIVSQILYFVSQIFTIAMGLILPIFAVLFVLEVLLGFVSKIMPQMNVFMISIPIKVYIGLFLILIFLAPTCDYISGLIETRMYEIMNMFSGG